MVRAPDASSVTGGRGGGGLGCGRLALLCKPGLYGPLVPRKPRFADKAHGEGIAAQDAKPHRLAIAHQSIADLDAEPPSGEQGVNMDDTDGGRGHAVTDSDRRAQLRIGGCGPV
jgi:hypothetical protein